MPRGLAVIVIDPDEGPKCVADYFEEATDRIEIPQDVLLRIQLLVHSGKTRNQMKTEDFTMITYMGETKKLEYLVGLFLRESESPQTFLQSIKGATLRIGETLNDPEQLKELVKSVYEEHFRTPEVTLDSKEIEDNVKERVKKLLKKGKTQGAQDLIEKAKKLPKKLYQASSKAEKAIKKKEYDKAVKLYVEAAEYAKELQEKDLAKNLIEKSKIAKKRPQLERKLEGLVTEARKSLREEKFHHAAVTYKKAADLSNEMMAPDLTEEYSLKANALADFAKVDARFKKK